MRKPHRPALPRSVLALVLTAGSLSGCGGVELVASGISDGVKWVLDETEGRRSAQGSPPPQSAPQPAATYAPANAAQPADMPPITAAPVMPVTKEPIR